MALKDNGDGTVTDSRTGLVWQQMENDREINYDNAVEFCDGLRLAGHTNWRLPSKEELMNLAQTGGEQLQAFFPGIQGKRYWALTQYSEVAWVGDSPDRLADRMAYAVEFNPNSEAYGAATTSFRFYNYCVRAVAEKSE